MIKEALDNLFAPPQPQAIVATVQRRVAPGRYELVDDAGRRLQAVAAALWPPGARVTVQGGRIIAAAGTATITTYEV
jgi:hypothetical protein